MFGYIKYLPYLCTVIQLIYSIMLMIKIKLIEQEKLLKKIYEDIKEYNNNYHLVANEDGDITFQNKEFGYDSEGYWGCYWTKESNKAWMRPHIGDDGKIFFYIIGRSCDKMAKSDYAFYHSELSRFLLTQFDIYIEEIIISGSVMEGDCIKNN